MHDLNHFKTAFNGVGWFIPPFVSMGFLNMMYKRIIDSSGAFTQKDLESLLSLIYSPENISAMVVSRYPIVPFINEYKQIIAESIRAHFLGLDHVAVTGLMPVIEGAGINLAKSRSINCEKVSTRKIFISLAEHCKDDAQKYNIGAVGEIISMMDSFKEYADHHLYIESNKYPHTDKTNRHGILHGAYADEDYGEPINFYKAMATVDFLCFISSFRSALSWFAPEETESSKILAGYYQAHRILCLMKPNLEQLNSKTQD